MPWWPIRFVAKFSVYVGNTFQRIQKMYVIHVLMMSMLTSNNNMRTRHVQILEFSIVTLSFIQLDCEISNEPNLSRVYCLLDQEPCVAIFCLAIAYKLGQMQALLRLLSLFCWTTHYTLDMLILLVHLLADFLIYRVPNSSTQQDWWSCAPIVGHHPMQEFIFLAKYR